MNLKIRKVLLLLPLIAGLPAAGQQLITISGMVNDLESAPVPFHQVFMTSSDSLLTKTFTTDESGFFRDSLVVTGGIITYLNFFTFDCNGMAHDTLVNVLNQLVFVEFTICNDTVPVSCQAYFSCMLDSLSFEPNTYQFYDQSTGVIDSWYWDFGDGSFSMDPFPLHQYADSGHYEVCLTVASMNNPVQCSDTYCQAITTPQYFNLGGLIFAGDYPLNNPVNESDTAAVCLYRLFQGQLWYMGSRYFHENGYYWFADIMEGDYLLKVALTENSRNYLQFMPTYFGDQVNWDAAQLISLYGDQFENEVHLVPVAELSSGSGTINGFITWEGFDPSGTGQQPSIILFNPDFQPVEYTWPYPSGEYEFSGLPYGQYYVKADLAGRPSEPEPVTLSAEYPIASLVELIVSESAYFGIEDPGQPALVIGDVYPNPARDHFILEIWGKKNGQASLSVFDITGRQYFTRHTALTCGLNKVRLDVSSLEPGMYIVMISSPSFGWPISRKFLK
jgi:PKD repeat protein